MKTQLLMIVIILTGMVVHVQSQPQQVIASSGGNYQNAGTSIEWTLGEQVISTLSASNTILTQGFHQPDLKISVTEILDELSYSIDAFPNPTNDLLMIKLGNAEVHDLHFILYDINGKVLEQKPMEGETTTINMINYVAGIYLLKVIQPGKEIMTYKIIKN